MPTLPPSMFRAMFHGLLIALTFCLSLAAQAAPRGVALIIGNAAYESSPLKNPANDAKDLAKALEEVGFEVMLKQNLKSEDMKRAIADFGDRLAQTRSVGLFYFSGHGIQSSRGRNYLLPVGAQFQRERDVELFAVEARAVLSSMEDAGNPLNIVVLDACRDSPLPATAKSAGNKGLARMDAPSGSLIAFATAPGTTASDNPQQRNGLYTKHLLAALKVEGLRLEDVFKRVGREVEKESRRAQSPEEMVKLRDDEVPFYFRPPKPVEPPKPPLSLVRCDDRETDRNFWDSIKNSRNRKDFQAYIEDCPNGIFLKLARNRLGDLEALAQNAVAPVLPLPVLKPEPEPAKPDAAAEAERQRQAREVEARRQAEEARQREAAAGQQATARTYRPGEVIRDCPNCPEMIVIAAGSFVMGGSSGNEAPAHSVQVPSFAMAKTEITQGQWRAVMGNNPSHFSSCGDDCPVESVSWDDAQAFVKKLSEQTGQRYRLPSEAEWEYACRAGGKHKYCGNDDVDAVAWHIGNSKVLVKKGGLFSKNEYGANKTYPVAKKRANAWGLYDMSGNVQEWVEDCYHDTYTDAPTDGSAWVSGSCQQRVLRGGSWIGLSEDARAAFRNWSSTTWRHVSSGFRVVVRSARTF